VTGSPPPRVPAPRSERPGGGVAVRPPMTGAARAASYPLLVLLGGVVGVAGCFAQALWFPGGLLLALAATAALFYGGHRLTGTRIGALLPALGWFGMLIVAMSPTPEGDFLLASSAGSYIYLFVGAVSGVICATLPPPAG
jgi:hypothetical protein